MARRVFQVLASRREANNQLMVPRHLLFPVNAFSPTWTISISQRPGEESRACPGYESSSARGLKGSRRRDAMAEGKRVGPWKRKSSWTHPTMSA